MRSGTSFFNGTVFKKTVLRFWPVWAAYSVIWFVAMPLNALMMLQLDAGARRGVNDGYMLNFARDYVPGLHNASLFFAVAFGALAAMAVCSHLYNAKSANFFGTLPVRREGLFLTHYLAGLAFLIVPNVVICLLTLLLEAAGGAVYLPQLLFWLGVTCGECLFFYSMAVFCGMFTGHLLALPAFYLIFNALAAALYYLLGWVFEAFYYGFHGFEAGVAGTMARLTPVMFLVRRVDAFPERTGMDTVAAYALVGVVLTAGSFLLYRFRRLESAGDVVSVRPMRPVFKYSVAICSGLFFGMLTAQLVYMHEPGLMASMLVWAIIGYFVAQMLLDKSFRVFHKWKGAAAVAGVFILAYLVVGFDLTGYETRVPTVDQVESVEFSGASLHHLGDGADYLTMNIPVDDPDFIQVAILLHQTAVDQRDMKDYNGYDNSNLSLVYHLKNGSTLTRWYSLWVDPSEADQEGSAAWAIQQIYDNRDLYWKAYGFEEAERRMAEEGYRLEQAWYMNDGHAEDVDQTLYYYTDDAEALYEAVKEDFRANRIGVRTVDGEDNWGAYQRNLQFRFVNKEQWAYQVEIYVQDTATSTLAVLDRLDQEGVGKEDPDVTQTVGSLTSAPSDSPVAYPTVSAVPELP